jgi:hypothetical protein
LNFPEQISGAGVGGQYPVGVFGTDQFHLAQTPANKIALRFSERARVLVRFGHGASTIVNANHNIM